VPFMQQVLTKTSFIQDHLADCENSVCQGCQLRLTTVPSEHKCRDETEVFRCPLIKIGCTAGKFVSFSQSDVHVALMVEVWALFPLL
jgi:Zn finger protein HypA/HybF involved in hydrogenase expression